MSKKQGPVYEGGLNESGKRHGHGTLTYSDGTTYVGEWKDGKKNGRGTLTYHDGDTYVGEWQDDKMHGYGKFTYLDGETYDGQWKDGRKNGRGVSTDKLNGDRYIGEWQDDAINGDAILIRRDKKMYLGQWKNDNMFGNVVFISSAGKVMIGEMHQDNFDESRAIEVKIGEGHKINEQDGKVAFISPDGGVYVGELKGGKRDGQGMSVNAGGSVYVGQWKDNKRHGQGVYTYSDGETYLGGWKGNKKEGYGILTRANGERYGGDWKDNIFRSVDSKNKSKPIIYIRGSKIVDGFEFIKETYKSRNSKEFFPGSDVDDLDIGGFIDLNKDDKRQVTIFIDTHGEKNGGLADEDEIIKLLQDIRGKIEEYNKKNQGEEIARIKLSLWACYGDKCIKSRPLMDEISEFVALGLEVRTSAVVGDKMASAFISNGKNTLPLSRKGENLKIVERIFSSSLDTTKEFYEDKKKKYLNVFTKVNQDQELRTVCEAGGYKVYSPTQDLSAGERFLMDDYDRPSQNTGERGGGENKKPPSPIPGSNAEKPSPVAQTRGGSIKLNNPPALGPTTPNL